MTDPQEKRMVCQNVSTTTADPVPGSLNITAGCGHEVWLSPTGKALLDQEPTIGTWCTSCWDPTLDFEIGEVPGQWEELAKALSKEEYAKARTVYRVLKQLAEERRK